MYPIHGHSPCNSRSICRYTPILPYKYTPLHVYYRYIEIDLSIPIELPGEQLLLDSLFGNMSSKLSSTYS